MPTNKKQLVMTICRSRLLACSLLAAFAATHTVALAQDVEPAGGKKLSTIVVDPGHGGKDPGALGRRFREKNIVLDVALRLGKMLSDSIPDLKVVFTRQKDVFVPLDERAKTAIDNSADLFISIHANSSRNRDVFGAETFLLGQHRSKENLEVAQKENSVITLEDDYSSKYEGFDPTQPESVITFAGMQSDYINKSIDMAVLVQGRFGELGRADRGVKQAGFLVLRQVPMPSVLVELGFISNAEEEAYMASAKGAAQLAKALFEAIRSFKAGYDGRQVVVKTNVDERRRVDLWSAGVNFRVQVAASSRAVEIDAPAHAPVSSVADGDVTKYMVGVCATAEEAQELKNSLKSKFPDCFVVAFDGKEKISVRSAKKRQKRNAND